MVNFSIDMLLLLQGKASVIPFSAHFPNSMQATQTIKPMSEMLAQSVTQAGGGCRAHQGVRNMDVEAICSSPLTEEVCTLRERLTTTIHSLYHLGL
jgi:hypothetical protein